MARVTTGEELAAAAGAVAELVVRGRLHAEAPAPPEPQAAITSPCVSPVEAVEAAG